MGCVRGWTRYLCRKSCLTPFTDPFYLLLPLKNELVHHRRYETRAEAEASIREYIEIFYNRQRRHSRLGNLAPAVFAQNFRKQQAA